MGEARLGRALSLGYTRDMTVWRALILFYEHFHGDTGRGLGASHQTGWTALITRCLEKTVAHANISRPSEQMEAVVD